MLRGQRPPGYYGRTRRLMLRLLAILFTLTCLLSAAPSDKNALITRLEHDLDRAMSRGTPTDKEVLELRKSRKDLRSDNREEFSAAIETIDRIAHTQSFKSQDASDIRKDI